MKSLGRDLWLKSTKTRKNKKIYNRVKADKNLQLTQVLKEFSIPISTFYYELKKEDFDKKNEEIISQVKLIFEKIKQDMEKEE